MNALCFVGGAVFMLMCVVLVSQLNGLTAQEVCRHLARTNCELRWVPAAKQPQDAQGGAGE